MRDPDRWAPGILSPTALPSHSRILARYSSSDAEPQPDRKRERPGKSAGRRPRSDEEKGVRAASFSLIHIPVKAEREAPAGPGMAAKRLLDEVDLITSVSGGSFTSAYYALYGERIFEDYEERAFFENLPTTLVLDDETVDRLIEVGRRLLRESPDFQALLAELAEARGEDARSPQLEIDLLSE